MPEFKAECADTSPKPSLNNTLPPNILAHEAILNSIRFLDTWLDDSSILVFSTTCRTAKNMSCETMRRKLLVAVICGDENLVRKIVYYYPELLLDTSVTISDFSGKLIKGLTPLQAAICSGDVEIVQMLNKLLQDKLKGDIKLSFDPKCEIQRQLTAIFPDGIHAVERIQKAEALKFKLSTLNELFIAINTAIDAQVKFELDNPALNMIITDEEIKFELDNPGQISTRRQLNLTLHNFRKEFTALSKQELIFNPFYVVSAYEIYLEQFNNFTGILSCKWNRRNLFWRQIIGYIQRHLPICYLQAFMNNLYQTAKNEEKLNRNTTFKYSNGSIVTSAKTGLKELGYTKAADISILPNGILRSEYFKIYCEKKYQVLRTLEQPQPSPTAAQSRNSARSSCCYIC